ncbi:helix-turn-helix domain-containing protein [Natronomonas sp. CBA1123]|jgi:DNA-binding IclR family transcriptional regulator|uniref:IclR family transcriptional regulator n=1 Tax=Natronomonas sp. CBA1123 TaxID=2668070 RepID=UPI0012E9C73C|nr:IclR family transcriptional regulator [Natronomonas sp. CBA1123]MUV85540.1 helix-turn-helix domain-containing protein [Natronomonas sp. CBA1123]
MKPTRTVKTADTLLSVINQLQALNGAGVTELATHLEMAKSTVHDHLMTLHEHGYVVKEDDTYYLSLRFLDHGSYTRERLALKEAVTPPISQLADDTEETVWFVVEERGQAVYLYREIGERGVDLVCRSGTRTGLHATAAGKVILAGYSDERVREITDKQGFDQKTPKTIADTETLLKDLKDIRDTGIAVTSDETNRGVKSVAVAVSGTEEIYGSVVVSGPRQRLTGEHLEDTKSLIRSAANEIELRIDNDVCFR